LPESRERASSAVRSAVAKSSASNAVSAVFIKSPAVGAAVGVAAVVGGLAGDSGSGRDAFHIAIPAIASARIAVAGSNQARTPVGAGGVDAGGPVTGGPVAGMVGGGVATGDSGTGGVTW